MSETITVKRAPLWAKLLLILFVVVLIAAAAVGGLFIGKTFGAVEQRHVQVIRSVTIEDQVILLTAGMSDEIPREGDAINVFGLFDLPGTERSLNVKFDFDGKFGIEGGDVTIEQTGEQAFRVLIPQFEYLGYENPEFSVIEERNGVLSWTTQEIDKLDVAEYALSAEAAEQHIDGFRPLLEQGARDFYTNIVTAIDPDVTLTFEFAD